MMGTPQADSNCPPSGNGDGAQDTAEGRQRQQIILDGDFLPGIFRTQTYQVAKDVCQYISRGEDAGPSPNRLCTLMRNLVEDTIKDRDVMMQNLVETLDVRGREDVVLVRSIAEKMFEDEQVNWGRIVTLHAFCASLTKHCEHGSVPDCADDIGNILAEFVINRLGLWVVAHGGWKAFEKQFPALNTLAGTGLGKGLLVIGLLVGAIIAFYTSVQFMTSMSMSS